MTRSQFCFPSPVPAGAFPELSFPPRPQSPSSYQVNSNPTLFDVDSVSPQSSLIVSHARLSVTTQRGQDNSRSGIKCPLLQTHPPHLCSISVPRISPNQTFSPAGTQPRPKVRRRFCCLFCSGLLQVLFESTFSETSLCTHTHTHTGVYTHTHTHTQTHTVSL